MLCTTAPPLKVLSVRLHSKSYRIREACPYQNGWIFGKVPNGLWIPPPPPSLSENHIANQRIGSKRFGWRNHILCKARYLPGMTRDKDADSKYVCLVQENIWSRIPTGKSVFGEIFAGRCNKRQRCWQDIRGMFKRTPVVGWTPNPSSCVARMYLYLY